MSTVTKRYKMNSQLKTILTSEGHPLYLAFLEFTSLVIQKSQSVKVRQIYKLKLIQIWNNNLKNHLTRRQ